MENGRSSGDGGKEKKRWSLGIFYPQIYKSNGEQQLNAHFLK